MATRVSSRRAMREQHDAAERAGEPDRPADGGEPGVKVRKTRARKPPKEKATPKPRARRKAVKAPPRVFARWAVCDNVMKRVAVFEYKDRAGADARLAEMLERKPGAYFLLLVKDHYDPPTPPEAVPVAAV